MIYWDLNRTSFLHIVEWQSMTLVICLSLFYHGCGLKSFDAHRKRIFIQSVMILISIFVLFLQKCCSDVFVEALLIPAIRSGEWGKLVDQIVLIDPSLEKWNYHLKSICKYLLKQKLHYILYEFQLIMKVCVVTRLLSIN